ncbi:hypothetical protein [Leptospira interrogans]|uniref:hypothetical protein n=1 Tax=Leptospira interrogans TaxID=173 RepID=UPI0002973341|nr:hypothetical protein [Leptospira interrogans]EKR43379.1 hypothetical protein LEP1GSC097_1642 [Leptospira interrogans serovar Grippotyphosa str. UI 08368]EMN66885.1 hypothetical protein LEP1GSC098_3653 [Leptospira interrogans serovar Grippotyphosa str. UI 08434]
MRISPGYKIQNKKSFRDKAQLLEPLPKSMKESLGPESILCFLLPILLKRILGNPILLTPLYKYRKIKDQN